MRIDIVTPWYPDYGAPFLGSFVKEQGAALRSIGHEVSIEVLRIYAAPKGPVNPLIYNEMREFALSQPETIFQTEGDTTWIPAPVPSRSGYSGRITAFADALALKRSVQPSTGDVTHVHLGVPTAAAVVGMTTSPLVVTEHQSTLDKVFVEPIARAAYRSVIENSSAFLVVSEHLRTSIEEEFDADFTDKIQVVPNVVNHEAISFKFRTPNAFRSWIYVGGISEHKGVKTLLKSFNVYKRRFRKDSQLTLVGDGPLRSWVERYAHVNGLDQSVIITGAIPNEKVSTHLHAADVMVHLSQYETFGIASLEGILAGLPVISLANGGAQDSWGQIEAKAGRILNLDSRPDEIANVVDMVRNEHQKLDPVAAREFVEKKYGYHNVAQRLEEIYLESLAQN